VLHQACGGMERHRDVQAGCQARRRIGAADDYLHSKEFEP
jgi:hypothetical protein